MSVDARIIWKLSVALMCAQGAWVMQLLSGVRDDEAQDDGTSIRDSGGSVRVRGGVRSVGNSPGYHVDGAAMKGPDEDRGQVIDFFDARCRRDWALYARRTGRSDQAPMR